MKRTPLKRKTPLKRVSVKRNSELDRYSKLRRKYLDAFPVCEVCKNEDATEIHHRKGREHGRLNQTAWFLAVGRRCHTRIHNDPKWAMKMGYMVSRIEHK